MENIKSGLPQFSFLNDVRFTEKPVKTIQRMCECEKHNASYEAEFYVYSNGSEYSEIRCPICEQEENEKEQLLMQKAEKEQNEKLCRECNIEPEYYTKSLDDYIPENEIEKEVKESVEKIISGDLKKLVLLGGNGTGKTMLGSIAAKKLQGKIYSMYEISTMIRQSYTMKAEKSELEIVNELASIPFLAIDEMGRTNGSNSEKNWLSYILDKRHVRNLPFMIMTNGHLFRDCPDKGCEKCFENYMDKDILSRLRQNSKLITIKAKDYRMK